MGHVTSYEFVIDSALTPITYGNSLQFSSRRGYPLENLKTYVTYMNLSSTLP